MIICREYLMSFESKSLFPYTIYSIAINFSTKSVLNFMLLLKLQLWNQKTKIHLTILGLMKTKLNI